MVFSIAWGIGGLYVFLPEPMTALFGPITLTALLYFLAVYAPSLSALVLSMVRQGAGAALVLIQTLRPRKSHWLCCLAVLLGWPLAGTTLVSLMMTWLYLRTGGDVLAVGLPVQLMNILTQATLPYVGMVYVPLAIAAAIALGRAQTTAVQSESMPSCETGQE